MSDERVQVSFQVKIEETPVGTITISLFPHTPVLAYNFVRLIQTGKLNNTKFFKMKQDYYIQGGDFEYNCGVGGQSSFGMKIYEGPKFKEFNKKFIIAMTNVGSHSTISQFFITLAPAVWLDGIMSPFGEVVKGKPHLDSLGFAALQEIQKVPVNEDGYLTKSVIMYDCKVTN